MHYAEPDVKLDHQVAHNGARADGVYAGWDRFGRIVRHTWVDGGFGEHASDPDVPNIPPILELDYGYDNAGNRTKMIDARPGASWSDRDWKYTYDGLDRLTKAERGADSGGGAWSLGKGTREWDLDQLDNWQILYIDHNGDGDYDDADDESEREDRAVNGANEYIEFVDAGDPTDLGVDDVHMDLTHTDVGNLDEQDRSATETLLYTHDAWNRLTKVELDDGSTTITLQEDEYNGLNWRIVSREDLHVPPDGTFDWETFHYYDQSWRMVEQRINTDYGGSSDIDEVAQYVWGERYIDDAVLRRVDKNADGDFEDAGDDWHYYITDAQFSVRALVDDSAALVERVEYTPYGVGKHHHPEDADGDGDVDAADDLGLVKTIDQPGYDVHFDIDRDGDNDAGDSTAVSGNAAVSQPVGWITSIGNAIGFCGSVHVPNSGLVTLRDKYLDPSMGRFLVPIGRIDYSLSSSNPMLINSDSLGCVSESNNFSNCTACCYHRSQSSGQFIACQSSCDNAYPDPSPPQPGTGPADCLDTDSVSEDDPGSCSDYPICACLADTNVRCMCECMGTTPWENSVRGCLQCMAQYSWVPWDDAHALCWHNASGTFGFPPEVQGRLLICLQTCAVAQSQICGDRCESPHDPNSQFPGCR